MWGALFSESPVAALATSSNGCPSMIGYHSSQGTEFDIAVCLAQIYEIREVERRPRTKLLIRRIQRHLAHESRRLAIWDLKLSPGLSPRGILSSDENMTNSTASDWERVSHLLVRLHSFVEKHGINCSKYMIKSVPTPGEYIKTVGKGARHEGYDGLL